MDNGKPALKTGTQSLGSSTQWCNDRRVALGFGYYATF